MIRPLPPLDAPAPGSTCPRCGEVLYIEGFCGVCHEGVDRTVLDPTRWGDPNRCLREEDDDPDAEGWALLTGAAMADLAVAFAYGAIALAILWLRDLPGEAQRRLLALAAIAAGSALILALVWYVDRRFPPSSDATRGRRPAGADQRRPEASDWPSPSRTDVAHGSTARSRPGGGLSSRLEMYGMGRTRLGARDAILTRSESKLEKLVRWAERRRY